MKPKKIKSFLFFSLIIINFFIIIFSSPNNNYIKETKLFSKIDNKTVVLNKSKEEYLNNLSDNIEYNYNKKNELTLLHHNLKKYELNNINSVIWTVSHADINYAVKGIKRAIDFFKNLSLYKDEYRIILYILDEVPYYLENKGINFNLYYGFVDREDLRLFMPSYKTFLNNNYGIMNVKLNYEFYISYFTHEVSHILTENILKSIDKEIRTAHHEYIAYIVQMETMDEALLKNILRNFISEKWSVFESSRNITYEYYLINSDGFAVKSYLFYKSYDGNNFFSKIFELDNEIFMASHK